MTRSHRAGTRQPVFGQPRPDARPYGNEEEPEPDREAPAEPPLEPLGPVEVPEPSVVDVPEPGIVEVPERRL